MAWDPATGDIVLFGGRAGPLCSVSEGTLLNDTWLWNGSAWTACASCTVGHMPPSARESMAMATDVDTGNLLLFGGNKQASASPTTWDESSIPIVPDGQTFVFIGTPGLNDGYWSLKSSSGPCPRTSPAMAWDGAAGRHRVVLFGGECTSGLQEDTWTWKASPGKWETCGSPCTTHPSKRSVHRMAWDPVLGETAMFGGRSSTNPTWCSAQGSLCNDTWTIDGGWTQCLATTCTVAPNLPKARCCVGLSYDPTSHLVIMFGGQIQNPDLTKSQLDDTWTFDGTTWTCVLGTCS